MIIKNVRLVWKYAKNYKALFAVAELCLAATYVISIILPLNFQRMVDDIIVNENRDAILGVVCVYFVSLVVSIAAHYFYHRTWQKIYNGYVVDIKRDLFETALFARAESINKFNSGDLMSRIEEDSDQFINVIFRNVFHFTNSIVFCVSVVFIIGSINWLLALIITLAGLVPAAATLFFKPHSEKYATEHKKLYGKFTGFLLETFGNIKRIILLGAQSAFDKIMESTLLRFIVLGKKIKRIDLAAEKIIYAFNLTTSIIIYAISIKLIGEGKITIGEFLTVISLVSLLHRKLNWLLRLMLDLGTRKNSIERVSEALNIITEDRGGAAIDDIKSISVKDVSFGYKKETVLNNVSFSVNRGDKVAIVGVSGVGKTTLFGLLLKLYCPQRGNILFNNINSENLSARSIRSRCCVVSQEIMLFDTSIRENLTLGKIVADEVIWRVLEMVDLRRVVEELPGGLDFVFSKFGDLSSGQKQRLLLARAIVKDSDVYFLDEATSAVDTETEQRIVDGLLEAGLIKTALVISHRFETIKYCNKVLVLKGGRVESFDTMERIRIVSPTFNALFPG